MNCRDAGIPPSSQTVKDECRVIVICKLLFLFGIYIIENKLSYQSAHKMARQYQREPAMHDPTGKQATSNSQMKIKLFETFV